MTTNKLQRAYQIARECGLVTTNHFSGYEEVNDDLGYRIMVSFVERGLHNNHIILDITNKCAKSFHGTFRRKTREQVQSACQKMLDELT